MEQKKYKQYHMNIHGYCTQCEETINEDFPKTLNTTTCKYFDKNFCDTACNGDKVNYKCVYNRNIPMCYSYSRNSYFSKLDFLHLYYLFYLVNVDIFLISLLYVFLFLFLLLFILIPSLISICYEFRRNDHCCKNFYKLFRLKTICIVGMLLMYIIGFFLSIFDFILRIGTGLKVIGCIIHTVFVIWVVFQLIVLWSHVIEITENSNLDKNTLPIRKKYLFLLKFQNIVNSDWSILYNISTCIRGVWSRTESDR
jgi:hypothetical protein